MTFPTADERRHGLILATRFTLLSVSSHSIKCAQLPIIFHGSIALKLAAAAAVPVNFQDNREGLSQSYLSHVARRTHAC